jgi:YfiH family protein
MNLTFFRLDFSSFPSTSSPPDCARFPFIFDGKAVPGVSGLVSSRFAGNMGHAEGENSSGRLAFFRSLGLDAARVYACTQIHSRDVREVGRDSPNTEPRADGLMSRDREIVLSVTVADCLPVFLYDCGCGDCGGGSPAEEGGLALVHSGWKGTGIALNALHLMVERWHTRPEEVAAILGPCIRRCCYRVDEERGRLFEAEFGGAGLAGEFPLGSVVSRADGAVFLDLQAANARLLAQAGVRNIAVCENCTFTNERLGSFRREGAKNYTKMTALAGFFNR